MQRLYILYIYISLCSASAQAQFHNYGTEQHNTKWKQLKTLHYIIIYPNYADSLANLYAQTLQNITPHLNKSLGEHKKTKYPVVLHTNNVNSNGMVAWAPKRIELITNPDLEAYPQPWHQQLVTHEARHATQTARLAQGVFALLHYPLGEQAAGIADFFVPTWFFEGDAVNAETALANTGRGRNPLFHIRLRTTTLQGKNYSLDKWYLGSYKDYTGGFYPLGYNMTAFARHQYGHDVWKITIDNYIHNPLKLPPFEAAFKKTTQTNFQQLFQRTFQYLHKQWAQQDSLTNHNVCHISNETKLYTELLYPQQLNDSTIVALQKSKHDINAIVALNNGKVKVLKHVGSVNSKLVLHNNTIYWTEVEHSTRWTHLNYANIKTLNVKSGKVKTLSKKQQFATPTVYDNIAALSQFTPDGKAQVLLYDLQQQDVTQIFNTPNNELVTDLLLIDNTNVVAVLTGQYGNSIKQLNTTNNQWTTLLQPTHSKINTLAKHKQCILFETGHNGVNNIYALDTAGLCTQLTNARFGAFQPATTNNQLLYSDYQLNGHRIATADIDSLLGNAITADMNNPYQFPLAEELSAFEQFKLDTATESEMLRSTLSMTGSEAQPYNKLTHTFNFHSWAPFYYDAINVATDAFNTFVKPGVTAMSQNHLNTTIAQVGYYYQQAHHAKANVIFAELLPVFNLAIDAGGKPFSIEPDQHNNLHSSYLDKTKLDLELVAYIPLNLSKNTRVQQLRPQLTYHYSNNQYKYRQDDKFRHYQTTLAEVVYYNYRKMAARDVYPKNGLQARAQVLMVPNAKDNYGTLAALKLTTYTPGITRDHALVLHAAYQYQWLKGKAAYVPQVLVGAPRGYQGEYQTQQQAEGKVDYCMTLAYPDWSAGKVAYVQRVRANLFYDANVVKHYYKEKWKILQATGVELYADWNALQITFPINTGLRITKRLQQNKSLLYEFLFSINL